MQTLKKFFSALGNGLVQLGKALMLPIAVLPIAGLLLRLGQPDLLNIAFISDAGGAVFNNLPVIFAVGVAIGFAKENHGAAALASFIGYLIMSAALATLDKTINMGVLGGIIVGVTAGLLYNRFHNIKLPSYLAFFGGRRFVPIITGATCLLIAVAAYFIWPPIGKVISSFGNWTISSGSIGLFFFGLANRLLIPLGLHHVLNNLVWFQFGDFATLQNGVETIAHGDLHRFFAGDPTAGAFMAGFFPIMMFGLPAACLAMIHTADTKRKKATAGILLSMALTSFLTGITEPVEFAFMFLAFPLYVVHAFLTGISMALMHVLNVKLGFTFSAGLFDYLLSYKLGTNAWMLLPVGFAYAVVYYFVFRFAITKWNLKTPGREEETQETAASPVEKNPLEKPSEGQAVEPAKKEEHATLSVTEAPKEANSRAAKYVAALGGKENLKVVDACATRLRLEVNDPSLVQDATLKQLGARGVVRVGENSVQVVIGPEADLISTEIKEFIN